MGIINQKEMHDKNLVEAFDEIRKNGTLTRKELQNITGMSWGGVSQIVSELISRKFICEQKQKSVSSGRTPVELFVNPENNFVIGVDVNLSGLCAVVMSADSSVVFSMNREPDLSDADSLLNSIFSLIDDVLEKTDGKNVLAIGISMQGKVNENTGVSLSLDKVRNWNNIELKKIVEEKYSLPCFIAHDPDCLITASKEKDALLFRIDYGIGMAVSKNGKLITGEGMLEIGKIIVGKNGKTLSEYATLAAIMQNADNKDFFENAVAELAVSVVNSLIVFDVNTVVICGKMLNFSNEFSVKLKENIFKFLPDVSVKTLDVNKAASGAAIMVLDRKLYAL